MNTKTGRLGGIWAPACTPLGGGREIDHDKLAAHLHRLVGAGCRGVVLFGTTGEATSFSVVERAAALDAVLDRGLDPGDVIVGTGCAAVADSVALTRHAAARECHRVLVLPPFYYKGVTDEGLFRSYATIIEGVADPRLQVFLYHIPQISTVPITPAVLGRLHADYPGIVAGMKDSSGDTEGTEGFIRAFPELEIFPGNELALLRLLEAGASGCITATANLNAPQMRRVYDMWEQGDPGVAEIQERVGAFRNVIDAYPMVPALKHLIGRANDDESWSRLRPPLVRLHEDELVELDAAVDALI